MYSDAERLIYKYWDGKRDRVADPLYIESTYIDSISVENLRGLNRQLQDTIRR
jgi:hypothetical protein